MSKPLSTNAFDNLCWNSNKITSPCQDACPLGTDAAGYIMATMMGEYDEAFRIISEKNPLPAVSSRICHHPCENQCSRGKIDQPIAIRALKRFAVENASEKVRRALPDVKKDSGKKVAVIGSGPAGLAAAYDLSVMGHRVSIFEKHDRPGGLLALALPSFILPLEVLEEDLVRIRALGVRFETGIEIKGAAAIRNLFDIGYSAVLLVTGAHDSVILKSTDYALPNVISGLSFLMKANEQARAKMSGRALIIGGGNVAIDSARVCVRKGADQVDIYCIEKQDEMPAFEWEKSRACIEDIHFHYEFSLIGTKRNKDGSLTCRFAHVKRISKDNNGALNPVIDKQKTVETVADHLIIAAGQRINKDNYQGLPMTQSPISSIDIGSNCMVKDFPGLFAAGDLAVLPGTLVNSIAGGKKAAAAINGFLDGNNSYHSISPRSNRQLLDNIPENLLAVFPKRERHKIPELSYKSAKTSFKEVEKTFGFSAAKGESARCLNCAVCGNCIYEQEQICLQTGSRLF